MRGTALRCALVGVLVIPLLAACGQAETTVSTVTARLGAPAVPPVAAVPPPLPAIVTPPAPLVDPALSITAPPVSVPVRFRAPSVGIDSPVLAVGRTASGAMDAPEGPAQSPLWQESFWYRGGSEPGEQGTTTIAGHVDDVLGRPAAFWNIRQLKPGDIVELDDTRTGQHDRYRITDTGIYSYAQANSPDLLQRLYGDAAYNGDPSLRNLATDAVSRISIITCTGVFHRGSSFGYDHRFIAFGVLVSGGGSELSDVHLF